MYFGRKRKYAAKLRAQERKKPSRIISLLLVISMLCGNFVGMPTEAAEMVAYCGMEEHTHSEACYCAVQAEGEAAAETLAAAVPTEETAAETTEETTAPTEGTALSVSGGSDAQALIGEYVEKELCCGMEEHKHDIACYANPLADLETAAIWEATLPEKLSGDWGKDLTEDTQVLGYGDTNEAQAQIEVSGGEDAETFAATVTTISGDIDGQIYTGRTVYLNGNAWADDTITLSGGTTTLDLNGNAIYYKGTGNFITLNNDAKLIIRDSANPEPVRNAATENMYGHNAEISYTDNAVTKLSYYVTESSSGVTGTTETLYKYELTPKGMIICENTGGAASVVYVNSGTFDLEGGLLTINNSANFSAGDAHIIFNKGTVNVKGGYICGGKDSGWGGGIYSEGTVNMSGGVIAGNYGSCGGGVAVQNGTFTMSGGVISGNGVHEKSIDNVNYSYGFGGGVFAKNSTVTISGGYITNNSQRARCDYSGAGCHGGGGLATMNTCTVNMTGGYVTGNYSVEAGGGLYLGHYHNQGTTFAMSGGIIASNYARDSEGGGIRVSGGTTAVIQAAEGKKVFITNNTTNTDFDWGGGGIFIQADGKLNISNTLITQNSSGGYGGGVGACPTGETLIVHTEGAAIYDNTSSGINMSQGGIDGSKNADTYVAKDYFDSNPNNAKYKDFFCVRNDTETTDISLVTGEMVGDGAANWSGVKDRTAVTISKTGSVAAKFLFALSADPDDAAKAAAVEAAEVIISGNHSNIHGGGIMTNGGLIIGKTDNVVYAPPSLEIEGKKALMLGDTAQDSGLDFAFELVDSLGANANVIGTATANPNTGAFTIYPEDAEHTEAGTYTYYLREKNDGRTGVTYDQTYYEIVVTISKSEVTLMNVTFTSFNVDSVAVYKNGVRDVTDDNTGTETVVDNSFSVHFKPSGWENAYLYIFENSDSAFSSAKSWPGKQFSVNSKNNGWYSITFNDVPASGTFKYIVNKGSSAFQSLNSESVSYNRGGDLWITYTSPEQGQQASHTTTMPSGFVLDDTGSTSTETVVTSNYVTQSTKSDGTILLTFNKTAFTNTKNLPLELKFIKTDGASTPLAGATFTLKSSDETIEKIVTTGNDGVAHFTNASVGIPRGKTYYLYETTAPTGYAAAGPWIIELGSDDMATIFPAKETTPGGALQKTSTTGTAMGKTTENGAIVLSTTITNKKLTSLKLTKLWQDGQGDTVTTNIPDSITVQLQKSQDNVQWTSVMDRTITPVNGKWETTFENLDVYVDHTASNRVKWQYRVVEKNGSGSPVTESGPITLQDGMQFNVSYGEVEGDADKGFSQTITNQEATTSITVKKEWKNQDGTVLQTNYLPKKAFIQLWSQVGTSNPMWVSDHELYPAGDGKTWETYTLVIDNLPITDASGEEYKYFVLENESQNGAPAQNNGDIVAAYNGLEFTVTYGDATKDNDTGEWSQTITNTYKPFDISVTKSWPNANSTDIPDSIWVTIQRRTSDTAEWETLTQSAELTPSDTANYNWKHTFGDLPKYTPAGVEYQYRVVELDENSNILESGSLVTIGNVVFNVSYSQPTADNGFSASITNEAKYVSLNITKKATDTNEVLDGATFVLEKEGVDGSTTVTTGTDGTAIFFKLCAGTYRLTETQAPNGYNLLASPIIIEITVENNAYVVSVNGESTGFTFSDNNLAFDVYNKPQLQMPATGGVGGFEFWILGGLLIMAVPLLMYTFIWYRKGGKYLQR